MTGAVGQQVSTGLVLVVLAASILVWPDPPLWAHGSTGRAGRGSGRWSTIWPVIGVVLAVPLLAPGWWLVAVPAGIGVHLLQRKMIRRPDGRLRLVRRRQLALILEMIASCLSAGLAPATAVSVVLRARGPQPGADSSADEDPAVRALVAVSALLAVGAGSESAWRPAARCSELAPLAAAATRTARGGVALAAVFRDRAEALRQECARLEAARSGRAGVLMTAPLGLCFLPAFLCLGLAPVVIGLLGSLHLW